MLTAEEARLLLDSIKMVRKMADEEGAKKGDSAFVSVGVVSERRSKADATDWLFHDRSV